MFSSEILPTVIKSIAVGLILGAVAYRWKHRSFIGWTAIGAAAAAVFPGLSLLALLALAWMPSEKKMTCGMTYREGNATCLPSLTPMNEY